MRPAGEPQRAVAELDAEKVRVMEYGVMSMLRRFLPFLSVLVILLTGPAQSALAVVLTPGDILVTSSDRGIIRVDPLTGDQTVVFAPPASDLTGIALEASGQILRINQPAFANVQRVDPVTGTGTGFFFPLPFGGTDIAIEASGHILVAEPHSVARFDPITGALMQRFSGGFLSQLTGIAVVPFPTAVPEPQTATILLSNLGLIAFMLRKARRGSAAPRNRVSPVNPSSKFSA